MEQQQPAAPDPLIGLTIGNYEIKSKLGEGGMGSVYLAEHPLIGKKVALKVLHAEFASNRDVVARFFTEAKSVNDIQHPNIVDIVDYGEIVQPGGNMVYFIMEFLDGESLSSLIHREAPFAPERALAIAMQVADCLSQSHAHGIVHRDLKPDNIILIERGRQTDFVKVLDFGIAKLTGDQPGSRRTRTGIVLGTPAYMSPEQCEGRGNVDHRTDIYALGILLYEMLTGRVPFQGDGYGEVLVQHLTATPVRPTTIRGVIPPHVEAVCMKALEKRPDDRYASMEQFMQGLADPVGYVEANGGLGGFAKSRLDGVYQPPAGVGIATPAPTQIAPLTPVPGTVRSPTPAPGPTQLSPAVGYTPPPGMLSPVPGQAGVAPTPAPGVVPPPRSGSRLPIIVAALVVVLGLGVGGYLLLNKSKSKKAVADNTDQPNPDQPNPDQPNPDQPNPDQGNQGVTPDQPAAPPDAAVPVVPKVEKVVVTVGSQPKGAEVFFDDETEPRGVTPLRLEVEKSKKKVKVTLKLDGYHSRDKTVVFDRNTMFELNLKKKRSHTKPPKPPKPPTDNGRKPPAPDDVLGPNFGK